MRVSACVGLALLALLELSAVYAQTLSQTPLAGMKCPGDKMVWVM